MLDWLGWIYLRTLLLLEHLAVLIKSDTGQNSQFLRCFSDYIPYLYTLKDIPTGLRWVFVFEGGSSIVATCKDCLGFP